MTHVCEPTAHAPTSCHGQYGLRMATVLLVEDDHVVRGAMLRSLADRGHAVHAVGTALDALRRVAAETPDLVVLDLGLPDLDGADALRMLRGITDVPIIIATARDDEQAIVRLLRAGADDYMVKPFTGAHLDARITTVLRRAGRASRTDAAGRARGRRAAGRRRRAQRLARRRAAGADPQGVRPAGLPRGPPGPGSVPPGAVGGGMATAIGRRGPDDRRASVLAAPETGRVRGEAALPAHRAGGRVPVGGTGLRRALAYVAAAHDRRWSRSPSSSRSAWLRAADYRERALADAERQTAVVVARARRDHRPGVGRAGDRQRPTRPAAAGRRARPGPAPSRRRASAPSDVAALAAGQREPVVADVDRRRWSDLEPVDVGDRTSPWSRSSSPTPS